MRYYWLNLPLRHIQLKLTTDCNMRCSHCYMPRRGAYMSPWLLEAVVGRPEFSGVHILLHGGEPTLYPPEVAVPILKRHLERGGSVSITTNGLNVDAIVALSEVLRGVSVSLDPPFSIRWRGNSVDYSVVSRAVRELKVWSRKKGFSLSILAILTKEWLENLDEALLFTRHWLRQGIRVGYERYVGSDPHLVLSNGELLLLSTELVRVNPHGVFKLISPYRKGKLISGWGCGSCGESVVIDERGICYICAKRPYAGASGEFDFTGGENFLIFWYSLKKSFAEKTDAGTCSLRCEIKDRCWGGCPWWKKDTTVCAMGRVLSPTAA